jgi:alpha-D-xyloside xylohydrolase
MPYIYSLTGAVYHQDYTIMRGLAMDFSDDKQVWNIGDQFMFGPSLLICPVYEYKATARDVYFPENTGWYNIYTGEFTAGGKKMNVEAPYERMPLYVREGSVLPAGPEIEYTDQKPYAPIDIYVYTGKDASFELYEDESTNYNYENGKFSIIKFDYSDDEQKLTIQEREGEFDGMIENREFRIHKVAKDQAVPFLSEMGFVKSIKYNGDKVDLNL